MTTIQFFLKNCLYPLLGVVILLLLQMGVSLLQISDSGRTVIKQVFSLMLIALLSWLVIKSADAFREMLTARYDVSAKDNLKARKVHTQIDLIRDIVVVLVVIIALATALTVFDKGKEIGKTILASAGIIGIVVGVSAQKTIATFIAGLQIAFTQPIRFDDVVIVEGEWGRIEDITLTYVVVRIWDQRRLIVPVTYFIEKPFQNWTRTSAEILGTVFIYADYTVSVTGLREVLKDILEHSEHWDKRVGLLQVTNASERALELRALMSAEDASLAWNLRCEVREKLVAHLQQAYPNALPKIRAELEKD